MYAAQHVLLHACAVHAAAPHTCQHNARSCTARKCAQPQTTLAAHMLRRKATHLHVQGGERNNSQLLAARECKRAWGVHSGWCAHSGAGAPTPCSFDVGACCFVLMTSITPYGPATSISIFQGPRSWICSDMPCTPDCAMALVSSGSCSYCYIHGYK